MDKKLLFKIAAICFMSLLLLVPLALIEGQIRDRAQRQNEVQASIANSAAGPQVVVGPVIALHYRERVEMPIAEAEQGAAASRAAPRCSRGSGWRHRPSTVR